MTGLLEVLALHGDDARRAAEGGADRVQLIGEWADDGPMSPTPALVEQTVRATDIAVRPVVRLREGFSTDGGEATRLVGLIRSYLTAGADGVVMGFLNGYSEIDREVIAELTSHDDFAWTFSRAVDQCLDLDKAWRVLPTLKGLDQVQTAGSALGVGHGLDELVARASSNPDAARLTMASGDLAPEHVPWLVRAGVRAFHIGRRARPLGEFKAWVDADLVRSWRRLIDDSISHATHTPRPSDPAFG